MPDPLSSLLAARSPAESQRILVDHPELLDPAVDQVLGTVLSAARADGQLLRVHTAERVRLLVRRCREVGVPATFDELTEHAMMRFTALLSEMNVPLSGLDGPDQLTRRVEACLQLVHHPGTAVADPPLRSAAFGHAAAALRRRFDLLGHLDDLHRAVELALAASNLAVAGSVEERDALALYGGLLVQRYAVLGDPADLSTATAVRPATTATDQSRLYNEVGGALLDRFHTTGDAAAVTRSIEAFEQARTLLPGDEATPPMLLLNLANARQLRWEVTGVDADLESTVDSLADAVRARPPTDPPDPPLLHGLATLLTRRFERRGDAADLQLAIDLHHAAPHVGESAGSPNADRLNELAATLYTSFRVTADPEQLDAAVAAGRQALQESHDAGPEALYLTTLGAALQTRWVTRGSPADLDAAVRALTRAVQATPAGHHLAADRLENLANALVSRATQPDPGRRQAVLNEAIALLERALAERPTGSPKRASTLLNLGAALRRRFELDGRTRDLDGAVEMHRTALLDLDAEAPIRPQLLCEIAADHFARFTRQGDLGDCAEAIGCYELALAHMTFGSDRPRTLHHLGLAYWVRHLATRAPRDADLAMRYSRAAAAEGLALHPEVALSTGFTSGHFASRSSRFSDAAEAFSTALEAAEVLVRLQRLRPHKERWLTATGNLAGQAGYALAAIGDPASAAVALERGRSLLLTEAIDKHQRLQTLAMSGHGALVERLRTATNRLADLRSTDIGPVDDVTADEALASLRPQGSRS